MARRLVSAMICDEAGNRLGGSGTELRIYSDSALTTLATLYANGSSGATLTQPLTPNAGKQTTLTVAVLITDTTITVLDVTGFAVGNMIPIYDGTNTVYRTITAINAGTKVITLDSAVGTAFATNNSLVGAADMIGHVAFYVDVVQDYYAQTKDVASTRVLPPIVFPTQVPVASINFQEEGVSTGSSRQTLNFIGAAIKAVDNAGQLRVDVTVDLLQDPMFWALVG